MGGVKNALKTVNFEEAFEDDVEDAAIHGIALLNSQSSLNLLFTLFLSKYPYPLPLLSTISQLKGDPTRL